MLSYYQKKIIACPSRFRVVCAGRRSGKTVTALHQLCYYARIPGSKILFVATTYKQSKRLMWKRLLKKLRSQRWVKEINKGDLEITLINGSTIMLAGSASEEGLRGDKYHFIVVDEAASQSGSTFYEVIRPMVADTGGDILFTGTPQGKNSWFHDLFLRELTNTNYKSFQFSTLQAGFVSKEEVDDAKATLSSRQFSQEYEASFINSGEGQVYYDFDRDKNGTDVTVTDIMPLFIGADFNIGIMAAVVCTCIGNVIYALDELVGDRDTSQLILSIKRRYPRNPIYIYPDASSSARKTSSPTTDLALMILGFGKRNVKIERSNPPISSRVSCVNGKICNALGERTFFVNKDKCPKLVTALERQQYKNGKPEKSSKTSDDDLADACGYVMVGLFGQLNKQRIRRIG